MSMKRIWKALGVIGTLGGVGIGGIMGVGFVRASQDTICMPTSGQVSGLQFAQALNLGLAAIISNNAGPSAPANACGNIPVKGQLWWDTAVNPNILKTYDGSQWVPLGSVDAENHVWIPPQTTTEVRAPDGSLSSPGFGFTAETNTGFRRAGPNDIRVTVGGTDILQVTPNGLSVLSGQFNFDPPGVVKDYAGSALPSGYLWADGSCVLTATYPALSAVLGTAYGTCSAGQFKLPDLRGRVAAGRDDMGGSAASRLTTSVSPGGTSLGATGGSQNHTMTTAQMPSHTHNNTVSLGTITVNAGGAHTATGTAAGQSGTYIRANLSGPLAFNYNEEPSASAYYLSSNGATVNDTVITGSSSASVSVQNHSHGLSGSPSISNASAGSGQSYNIIQPTIVLNKIIKF